ncbi:glutamine--fructose-6-phosphate aminotransferase, partial [Vibrio alginolyticus]|nr:glutamine--fructose-6-phosphate aminotransferase [Vibrio alginolyticus]
LLEAVQKTVKQLEGAYGTVVVDRKDPSRLVVARSGSPIVIGFGVGENFLASDQLALLSVTRRFMYLEEGDVAEVTRREVNVFNTFGEAVTRDIVESNAEHDAGDKGQFRHFMQKEIFEQPKALINTMEGRLTKDSVVTESIGVHAA